MGIRTRRDGLVSVVTIDRPEKANALSPELFDALVSTVRGLDEDTEVRAIVVTGAGERHFCAGSDLGALAVEGSGPLAFSGGLQFFPFDVATPLVAAVNGMALGGGFELALTCDVVVAAEHARFGLPEVARGLVAGAGGTRLSAYIPLAFALEIALTGEMIDARRAEAMGLVNRVVPAASVLDEAMAVARSIAANAPLSVLVTKALLWEEVGLRSSERDAVSRLREVVQSADALEGPRAFVERRSPRWSGA